MQPFTEVSYWPNGGQDSDAANEIVQCYFEKRLIAGDDTSSYGLITTEQNAQRVYNSGDGEGKNVFQEMQEWMEEWCTSFLDTRTADSFLSADKQGFVYFTKATWQEAAGLNVSGTEGVDCLSYRRKVNLVDSWSYGTFLPGDIRGPWCFEDLQNGLKALKWTKMETTSVYGNQKELIWGTVTWGPDSPGGYTWEQQEQRFADGWALELWNKSGTGYTVSALNTGPRVPTGALIATRSRFGKTITLADMPRYIDIYLCPTGDPGPTSYYLNFDDLDLEPDKYGLYRSEPLTSDVTIDIDLIGNIDTNPMEAISSYSEESGVFRTSDMPLVFVIKWQWSYGEA